MCIRDRLRISSSLNTVTFYNLDFPPFLAFMRISLIFLASSFPVRPFGTSSTNTTPPRNFSRLLLDWRRNPRSLFPSSSFRAPKQQRRREVHRRHRREDLPRPRRRCWGVVTISIPIQRGPPDILCI